MRAQYARSVLGRPTTFQPLQRGVRALSKLAWKVVATDSVELATHENELIFLLEKLTKVEEDELRAKLVSIDLDSVFPEGSTELTVNEFMALLNEHHEGFSSMEIHVLFQMVDKDRSGLVDKHEILSYATRSGKIDVEDLYHQRQKYKEMQAFIKKKTSVIKVVLNT